MRNFLIALFACGALLQAELVVPGSSWVALGTPAVNAGDAKIVSGSAAVNSAFWNGDSSDSSGCSNIGCYILDKGEFAAGGSRASFGEGLTDAVFLANSDGSGVSGGFYFTAAPSTPVTLLFEWAGYAGNNTFGWYKTTAGPSLGAGDWGVLFSGSASPLSTSVTFSPGDSFGFWLLPNYTGSDIQTTLNSGTSVFTQTARNKGFANTGAPVNNNYFALFASADDLVAPPTTFYMGIEDLPTDLDYNDMIVKFTVVPEPGFYGALALGLAGVYMAVRRKKA